MFPKFADVLAALNELKERGLIQDYAISGAMAQVFWDEAIPTFDLDVLVMLGAVENALAPLAVIYQWAKEKGYETRAEHILISDIPVQFVPAPDTLSEEAVKNAKVLEFKGLPVRVVAPEYLIALWLKPPANTYRRLERIAKLRESLKLDTDLLADLRKRYNL